MALLKTRKNLDSKLVFVLTVCKYRLDFAKEPMELNDQFMVRNSSKASLETLALTSNWTSEFTSLSLAHADFFCFPKILFKQTN